ncbi:RNA polymerase sigma factor [Actinoallomurus sp. CA-150999]|uniref:RNA polymerase sigma factor n=1 Tax=Actinoallomurus sp. CA-150999 TaxID=3239887 RepID=UPI003D94FD76
MPEMIAESMAPPDSKIISASRDDPDAFAGLFDRYSAMLYRYAVKRLGPEVAEDLVGETFLVAFQKRHRYDPGRADARPWLFGIITKLISRHHRRESARYRALERALPEQAAEDPVERALADIAARSVRPELTSALAELSRGDRDVLLLIAWADLSYEETATALGIPIGTVRSRLNRARRKVRAALGGTDPTKE